MLVCGMPSFGLEKCRPCPLVGGYLLVQPDQEKRSTAVKLKPCAQRAIGYAAVFVLNAILAVKNATRLC